MPERAFSMTVPIDGVPPHTHYVSAKIPFDKARSKARMQCLRDAWEAGFELKPQHVKVRSLGIIKTPLEIAQETCDAFNAQHRIGSLVKCYPVIPPHFRDEARVRVLTIREPGAYVMSSGHPVVATTGGQWAIEAVLSVDVNPPAPVTIEISEPVYDGEGVPF